MPDDTLDDDVDDLQDKKTTGRPEERIDADRHLRAIAKRASVEDVSLHDLRRSAIARWTRKLPRHVVQRRAGHSSIPTTIKFYLSVQPDELERAKGALSIALPSDPKRTQEA